MLFESLGTSHEDDPFFSERFLHIGICCFRIILGLHSGEERALLLGHSKPVEGFENLGRNFVPRTLGLGTIREIITNTIEINVVKILGRPVGGHGLGFKNL